MNDQSPFRQQKLGVEISLHVLPNAPKNQIIGLYDGKLKIKINAPPVDGKANEAIIDFFSGYLKISKNKLQIIRGENAKSKTILILGIPLETLRNHLLENTNS
jgi:uncharacterized protein (TIGR00251 family)